jgi:hypothetical protein
MMNKGNEMKRAFTADEIIELIIERSNECIELAQIFKNLGNRKMIDQYEGEMLACSTLLYRIQQGKEQSVEPSREASDELVSKYAKETVSMRNRDILNNISNIFSVHQR